MSSFTIPFKEAIMLDPDIEGEILSKYPLFNEDYRPWLNMQIKDQFWNREIGVESVSMFKLSLRRKLNQIMPYYNQQYKADMIAKGLDPLQTIRIENTAENEGRTESTGDSNTESASESKARAIASDFPQTMISENGDYASNGSDNVSATGTTSKAGEKSATTQTANNKGVVTGSQGQASVLLMNHRQTLVNVDLMVLNDLEDLFMGIWSTGDSYTKNKTMGITAYGTGLFGYGSYGF